VILQRGGDDANLSNKVPAVKCLSVFYELNNIVFLRYRYNLFAYNCLIAKIKKADPFRANFSRGRVLFSGLTGDCLGIAK